MHMRGASLIQSVEHETLGLRVMSSSLTMYITLSCTLPMKGITGHYPYIFEKADFKKLKEN